MEIKNVKNLEEDVCIAISEVFVEGFYKWLSYFSKNKTQLVYTFKYMFILDKFYVALVDGEVAGIAACSDGKLPCVKLNSKELRRHLGIIKGSIASRVLKREFENHTYPFDFNSNEKTASVEFVATSPKYRGKGVASGIIQHFLKLSQYDGYALEVADTNIGAISLYEKLGFKEFTRVKMKSQKRSGVNYLVYMKYKKYSNI